MTAAESRTHRADVEFAPRFRRLRRRAGLTQKEFAEMADIKRETVGRWERGQSRPYLGPQVRRAAEILLCRPDYLLWGDEEG